MKLRWLIGVLIGLCIMSTTCKKQGVWSSEAYKGKPKHAPVNTSELNVINGLDWKLKIDSNTEAKLNKRLSFLFENQKIAGMSVTIAMPNRGIWTKDTGYVSVPNQIKVDKKTVFYWASVGKLITSIVIFQLIEEKKLRLDSKIENWFPAFQNSNRITIEHLLTHTSGIYSFNSDTTFHQERGVYRSPNELLKIALGQKNLFQPGEYWSYSNTGYLLLALIAEKIENKTFHEIVNERITKKHQLTSIKSLEAKELPQNLALAHSKNMNIVLNDYSVPLGAGNIVASSLDMAKLLALTFNGKLVSSSNLQLMLSDLYPMFDNGLFYGKGIMWYEFTKKNGEKNNWIGHSGGTEDYKAIVVFDYITKSIISVAINRSISAEAVANSLLEELDSK